MLKTIIFDIDGVITNLSYFHFLAWKSVLSFHNIDLNNKEWETVVGLPRMVIINKILANHHVKLTSHQIEQIAEQKNELFLHLIEHGLTPKDVNNGIRQLIDSAIKRGLQLVAISSSSNAVFEMKCLGLYDKFLYVSSYDKPSLGSLSKQEKNQISPLTYAFKSLGIKGEDCIGLEDNIDGIIEFKKFKVFAVAIANFREDIKQEGDYWVDLPEQINLDEIIFSYYKRDTIDS